MIGFISLSASDGWAIVTRIFVGLFLLRLTHPDFSALFLSPELIFEITTCSLYVSLLKMIDMQTTVSSYPTRRSPCYALEISFNFWYRWQQKFNWNPSGDYSFECSTAEEIFTVFYEQMFMNTNWVIQNYSHFKVHAYSNFQGVAFRRSKLEIHENLR